MKAAAAGVTMLALILAGCGGNGEGTATTQSTATATANPAPHGQPLPVGDGRGGIALQKIGDFDQPVYVTSAPGDARDLFVVEQPGKVIDVRDGETSTFLDLSGQVSCCGEQGLLSIAFDPDYQKSGLFYADYTDRAGDTKVVAFVRSGDQAKRERSVLTVDQPYSNHNGGQLQFGPDGRLYVGLGDGGSENDPDRVGQDPASPLAKILVIDPSQPDAKEQTFASGLRNPWRFSFDRRTGDLWIGDVGQDTYEEVDGVTFQQADGANFGWSAFEGNARFNKDQEAPGAIRPVLTYTHDDGCSVSGGYVVRDPDLPSLYGRYVYGDFCSGVLHSFTAKPGQPASDDRSLGLQVPSLSSFGEDNAGHIYAASLEGPVYRLVQSPNGN
jgi:glucose/arabinose dehydrogenase